MPAAPSHPTVRVSLHEWVPSRLTDEGKLPEQGLPSGKEFSGRHQGTLPGFEPESFWTSGVSAYQDKGNHSSFTFSITET